LWHICDYAAFYDFDIFNIPPQMMCDMKIEYAGGAGILLVNDCCLTPIQQFSALSWPEQDNFQ
jgi:hypothetical protein